MSVIKKNGGKTAIFLYESLDNDLEPSDLNDLLRIQRADIGDNIEIYVYLDRQGKNESEAITKFDATYDEWLNEDGIYMNGAMYGKYVYDDELGEYRIAWTSPDGSDSGVPMEMDSADRETLTDFLDWCAAQTEAEHQVLFLSDHGGGYLEAYLDDTEDTSFIPLQIAEAINDSDVELDVLAFNACQMSNAEAISCFAGVADYLVGSEEVTISDDLMGSFAFPEIIAKINGLEEIDSRNLAQAVLDGNDGSSRIYTLSIISNDGTITDILNDFGRVADDLTDHDWMILSRAFRNQKYAYYQSDLVDIQEVLQEVLDAEPSEVLRAAAEKVIEDLGTVIVDKVDGYYHGEGVTVFSPLLAVKNNAGVSFSEFNLTPAGNDTAWSNFVFRLYDYADEAGLLKETPTNAYWCAKLPTSDETDYNVYATNEANGKSYYIDMSFIGGVIGDGLVFKHNYWLDTINSKWLCLSIPEDEDALQGLSVTFDFEDLTEQAANVTLSVYEEDEDRESEGKYYIGEKIWDVSGSGSLTIDLSEYEADGCYFIRLDTSASVGFTITCDSDEYFAEYDFYDVCAEDKSMESPYELEASLYYGSLIVQADTEEESFSDYFTFADVIESISVVVVGLSDDGESDEDILSIEEYDSEGTFLRSAEYSEEEGGYVLSDICEDNIYKISTESESIVSYSIYTTLNGEGADGDYTIKETSRLAVEDMDNSYVVGWNCMNRVTDNCVLQLSMGTDYAETVEVSIDERNAAKVYNLGSDMEWRVRCDEEWAEGETLTVTASVEEAKIVASCCDQLKDIFFANKQGIWESGYAALNTDTGEQVLLAGKNKICDIFRGTEDANVLLLTDDANGDAFFIDDIYSASADDAGLEGARFSRIREIRAGAGDDIIDMTSQRFEVESKVITIYGGAGDDIIWAAGNNANLFGDAGNDRLTGTAGNDWIIGGSGDDVMNGNGGKDLFTFCKDWGHDEVIQQAGGSVILWFAEGSLDNWDEASLTYRDGDNSVVVQADDVSLKFGDYDSMMYPALQEMGAFSAESTEYIFEKRFDGALALG